MTGLLVHLLLAVSGCSEPPPSQEQTTEDSPTDDSTTTTPSPGPGSTGIDPSTAESTGSSSTSEGSTNEASSSSADSGESSTGDEPSSVPQDNTPPVFMTSIIGLDGAYDPESGQLGELLCTTVSGGPEPYPGCFRPFAHPEAPAAPEDLGAITFIAQADAEIHAAAGGFVDQIEFITHDHLTHSNLYLLRIRLGEDSAFWHEYIQIKDLLVEVGDPIEAGDVLGRPGDYHDLEHAKIGFGVVRHQEVFARLCPTRFADDPVLEQIEAAMAASNEAFGSGWEAPCLEPALACVSEPCDQPASFVPVGGDIDRGRRRYESQCAMCHGAQGEGDIADPILGCRSCVDQTTLAAFIDAHMPPTGASCSGQCAEDVAAFILWEFRG
ncbi:MAG: c-type cytochrome [Myxococcota bacterium]